jgi:eukaryotic-like serine/threonine-protein kinase
MPAVDELLNGRYRIKRQLGFGGMGAVYEAEDYQRFGKAVALKEIRIDFTKVTTDKQKELIKKAFEREAKILTQLEHEAFPQVVDYFVEGDRQFLVMELIQGDDLDQQLSSRQEPFALEEILNLADQLLDALDYLHTLNPPIIHRDIKPHNLKITRRGRVKLLDFGIAKGSDTAMNFTITNQTFLAATLHYSPFEQILRVIDPSSIARLMPPATFILLARRFITFRPIRCRLML